MDPTDQLSLEVLDQNLTRSLREIESNFLKANKVGESILQRVKRQNTQIQDISSQFEEWCLGFEQLGQKLSEKQEQSILPEEMYQSTDGIDIENLESPGMQSICSYSASDGNRTPRMPKFRTSLAKTPALLLSAMSNDSSLSGNGEKLMSPPRSTRFYKPSKTPGLKHHAISRIRYGESPSITPQSKPVNGTHTHESIKEICTPPLPTKMLSEISLHTQKSQHTPGSPPSSPLAKPSIFYQKENIATPQMFDDVYTPASANNLCTGEVSNKLPTKATVNDLETPTLRSPLAITNLNTPMAATGTPKSGQGTPSLVVPGSTRTEMMRRSRQQCSQHQKSNGQPANDAVGGFQYINDSNSQSGTPLSKRIAEMHSERHTSVKKSQNTFPFKHNPMSIRSAARARSLVQQERTVQHIAQTLLDSDVDSDDEYHIPTSPFSLDLFPKYFQTGKGAVQITAVYSSFGEGEKLDLDTIKCRVGDVDVSSIEILLDLLVSRKQIVPMVHADDKLLWHLPVSNCK